MTGGLRRLARVPLVRAAGVILLGATSVPIAIAMTRIECPGDPSSIATCSAFGTIWTELSAPRRERYLPAAAAGALLGLVLAGSRGDLARGKRAQATDAPERSARRS